MTGKLAGGGVDKPGQSAAPGALCTRSDRHALSSSMGHDLLERLSSPCRKNKLSSVEPAKCQPGWGLLPNATGCQPQPTYKAQLRRSLKCSPSTVAAMARLAAARPWPLGLDQWVHGRPVPGQFYKAWLGNDSEALKPCNQMEKSNGSCHPPFRCDRQVGIHFVWPNPLANRFTNIQLHPSFWGGGLLPPLLAPAGACKGPGATACPPGPGSALSSVGREAAILFDKTHTVATDIKLVPTTMIANLVIASFNDTRALRYARFLRHRCGMTHFA